MTRLHGLGKAGYDALLRRQRGRCAICLTPFADVPGRRPCIDHDHDHCAGSVGCAGCVRGALCNGCNNTLRLTRDDPAILRRAIRYLRRHSATGYASGDAVGSTATAEA